MNLTGGFYFTRKLRIKQPLKWWNHWLNH